LPSPNRSLMNSSSSKSFGVYARWTTDMWQVLVHSCEACIPGARTTNISETLTIKHRAVPSWHLFPNANQTHLISAAWIIVLSGVSWCADGHTMIEMLWPKLDSNRGQHLAINQDIVHHYFKMLHWNFISGHFSNPIIEIFICLWCQLVHVGQQWLSWMATQCKNPPLSRKDIKEAASDPCDWLVLSVL
jgi:hypothetical protein